MGVWSLPWHWHILSILLTAGRGISTETCGLGDVFPPDDPCSHPETLCWYIFIYTYALFITVIGRIYKYTRSVVQRCWSCTPSQSIGLVLRSARFLCWMPLVFFGFTHCVLLYDNKTITRMFMTIGIRLKNFLTLSILSEISNLPGCFCPGTSFQNTGFNMVPSDPFMSHPDTQIGYIFCRGVSDFATDCACGVLCRGLTTFLMYVGPLFGNRLLNNSWAVSLE